MMIDLLQTPASWLALVDVLGKATLLLGGAALLATLLRRATAASRHLVWTCALLSALALPLLTTALPRWQLALVTIAAPASAHVSIASDSSPGDAAPGGGPRRDRPAPAADRSLQAGSASVPADLAGDLSWTVLLAIVWSIGATLILARLAGGIVAVNLMSRRTTPATGAPWLPLARQLAGELRIGRVSFRRSASSSMPMTWGILRPVVVLPAAADSWPAERLRIALLHELAHVKRGDCLTHMLAQVACACYWMNPLAWLAAGRARAERERACDDLVLAFGTDGADYADELLEIARSSRPGLFSTTAASASLAMARRSQLEGRLMAILDPSVPRNGLSRVRTAGAIVIALLALVPLASLQTWATAEAAMVPQLPPASAAPTSAAQPATPPALAAPADHSTTGAAAAATPVPEVHESLADAVTQGIAQGIASAVPNAVDGVLEAQNPNPNPNPDPDVRHMKSKADPKVVAALTAALDDSDKEVRESAMQALVRLRDPGVYEPLVRALEDTSADVRETAVHGLGQLRDKRAVAPIIGVLKDTSPSVREQAVFALGQLRDPAAVDPLVGALRDESASVREQAAFALGQIRDDRAVEPLLPLLKDAAADVREQAVFALGQIRSRKAVDALIATLKDEQPDVRGQAAFALGQIRDPRAIDALSSALKDGSTEVRRQAAFALGQLAR